MVLVLYVASLVLTTNDVLVNNSYRAENLKNHACLNENDRINLVRPSYTRETELKAVRENLISRRLVLLPVVKISTFLNVKVKPLQLKKRKRDWEAKENRNNGERKTILKNNVRMPRQRKVNCLATEKFLCCKQYI